MNTVSPFRFNNEDIIWENTLDNKYRVVVTAEPNPYGGRLIIYNEKNLPIYIEWVAVTFGARYGPDVDDVALWEDMAIKFIDEYDNSN